METKHKDWIQKHFVEILQNTNLEILLEYVKRKNIFPEILLERYQLPNVTPHKKKRQFYLDIQKRGPKAYSLLLEACQESGHQKLYTILNTESTCYVTNENVETNDTENHARPFFHSSIIDDPNSKTLLKLMENTSNTATLNIGILPKDIKVIKSKLFMDDPRAAIHEGLTPYRMRGLKRGVVFVINNIQFQDSQRWPFRTGAEVDAKNLKELFTQLEFEWIYWENQTHRDIETKLREFARNPILRDVDSCFVIIMSHGIDGDCPEDTYVICTDNQQFKATEIVNKFSNLTCPSLQNKPKVIVFQVCRGNMTDHGVKIANEKIIPHRKNALSDGGSNQTLSYMSDALICYASYPGYESYRDPAFGTWLIQHFCEKFMDYAHEIDVQRLFNMISHDVDQARTIDEVRQTPYISTIKFRPCFLNPGML